MDKRMLHNLLSITKRAAKPLCNIFIVCSKRHLHFHCSVDLFKKYPLQKPNVMTQRGKGGGGR